MPMVGIKGYTTNPSGWVCFFVAIFMIGVMTAVIGDVASHFGCTIGLKDSVTAISLVAVGTSIPGVHQSRFIYFQTPLHRKLPLSRTRPQTLQ